MSGILLVGVSLVTPSFRWYRWTTFGSYRSNLECSSSDAGSKSVRFDTTFSSENINKSKYLLQFNISDNIYQIVYVIVKIGMNFLFPLHTLNVYFLISLKRSLAANERDSPRHFHPSQLVTSQHKLVSPNYRILFYSTFTTWQPRWMEVPWHLFGCRNISTAQILTWSTNTRLHF